MVEPVADAPLKEDVVERVARALHKAKPQDWRDGFDPFYDPDDWEIFIPEARAAIVAMRDIPASFAGKYFFFDHAREAWKDMVDAILLQASEGGGSPNTLDKLGGGE
jgi:hypothetical protein